jgi:hypothetical protein
MKDKKRLNDISMEEWYDAAEVSAKFHDKLKKNVTQNVTKFKKKKYQKDIKDTNV